MSTRPSEARGQTARPPIIFDLDGTLVDSIHDIAAAVNRMLADEAQPELGLPVITGFVGDGLPKLIERVIDHCGMDRHRGAELSKTTLDYYMSASTALTRPFPGVSTALAALAAGGYSLGICTNKPEQAARHVLKDLDIAGFFNVVIGGDTLAHRKPDRQPLDVAFDRLGQGQGLFVGDSEVDAQTARAACVPFVLFTDGYRKTAVEQIPHALAFSDWTTFTDVVSEMRIHQTP